MKFCVSDGTTTIGKGIWILAVVAFGTVASCAAPATDDRPVVAVSVAPLAYLVDRIGGGSVRVVVMVPAAANPATHEPSISQLRAAEKAALYVIVGHPHFSFEQTWLSPTLDAPGRLVVRMDDDGVTDGDAHLWLAPDLFAETATMVAEALADLMPDRRDDLEANTHRLRQDVAETQARIQRSLEPHRGRSFMVFHPAWSRFAASYGLVEIPIEAEGTEPSVGGLSQAIERGRAAGVKVVFVQPQFASNAAKTVARDLDARVETLDPLAYDWVLMMEETVAALVRSFE